MRAEFTVRAAGVHDRPSMREIYNHYVVNSTVTFDQEPVSAGDWEAKFADLAALGFPVVIAESPTYEVLGYALVAPWKKKPAYRFTVENSIYLKPGHTGRGIGRALFTELIDRAQGIGLQQMIAVIADQEADVSIAMHERHGFVEVGRLERVGYKFDRWIGTVLMQRSLDAQ